MRNFVGDTISAFQAAGVRLYNHAAMMLPLHSLPMRASNVFNAASKLGMCHQVRMSPRVPPLSRSPLSE